MKVTDNEEPPKTTVKETNRGTLIIGPWKGATVPRTKKVNKKLKGKPGPTLKASIKKPPKQEATRWNFQNSPVGFIWILVPNGKGLDAVKFSSRKEFDKFMLFEFSKKYPNRDACVVVSQPGFYVINTDKDNEDEE